MTIVNIRGTSGSGKSTLVHRFLAEHPYTTIEATLNGSKKPKIVAYKCEMPTDVFVSYTGYVRATPQSPTYIIGSYKTQCGGCDSMSYKGSHNDIEELVRAAAEKGNVIFEGLTISSTLTRWQGVSDSFPGEFVWAFMMTPEEECHQRILARNGGKEPKRDAKGLADYQRKYRGCMNHIIQLRERGERVLELTSDDEGYEKLLGMLNN